MCVRRAGLGWEHKEVKSADPCTVNRKTHVSLGAADPKDSNGVCQAVENAQQYIWKSFPECPYLDVRVSVRREMESPKARAVRDSIWVPGQSGGDKSKHKLKIF